MLHGDPEIVRRLPNVATTVVIEIRPVVLPLINRVPYTKGLPRRCSGSVITTLYDTLVYIGRSAIRAAQAVPEPCCGIILMRGYLIAGDGHPVTRDKSMA